MDMEVYGYCINESVEFRVDPPLLVNTLTGKSFRLRATMARLLCFLLEGHPSGITSDNDIMVEVFEKYGLKCSSQTLWQAIKTLRAKLAETGLGPDLILRVNHRGFIIDSQLIKKLYSPHETPRRCFQEITL